MTGFVVVVVMFCFFFPMMSSRGRGVTLRIMQNWYMHHMDLLSYGSILILT